MAIDVINNGGNIFVTGGAGRGKSWIINQIKDDFTVLVAPTGIAALNIGGATAHSCFGLPFGMPLEEDIHNVPSKMYKLFGVSSPIKRIIIDEVGMMRPDYLDLIDLRLKKIRMNDDPFGGIQVVCFGDLYQLEPIVSAAEKPFFDQCYQTSFCFSADCWEFPSIELTKSYRQKDTRQAAILDSIRRKDKHHKLALKRINDEAKKYIRTEDSLHLTTTKESAHRLNSHWYSQVDSPEVIKTAEYSGTIKQWEKEAPVDISLKLKIGDKVLICANGAGYVNGSRGVITSFEEDDICVKLSTGVVVKVSTHTWEKVSYMPLGGVLNKNVDSYFTQFPIRLGWAITVHKSQGMTLQNVTLDLGRGCFSHGQLYTGLSRITDLTNLKLVRPVRTKDLIVRQEVINFYNNL